MELATRFSVAHRKGGKRVGGEATITLRAGDEANVILAVQGSTAHSNNNRSVVSTSVLHSSTSLTVTSNS